MSDLSGLERSFALSALPALAPAEETPGDPALLELLPHEVGFRRLRSYPEIARILHLRHEIALPASAQGAGFAQREKKETRSASWAPSCALPST